MTIKQKLEKEIKQILSDEELTPEQRQEILLTILSHSTSLYMEMLKINLELKRLPTRNLAVVTNTPKDKVM